MILRDFGEEFKLQSLMIGIIIFSLSVLRNSEWCYICLFVCLVYVSFTLHILIPLISPSLCICPPSLYTSKLKKKKLRGKSCRVALI